LVAELNGQIKVPDAPGSRFVLEMKSGKKYSLLENSENLCQKPQKAIARFTGQNGKVETLRPMIANGCPKKKTHKKKHAAHKSKGKRTKAGSSSLLRRLTAW
jgi:hypothetical protein